MSFTREPENTSPQFPKKIPNLPFVTPQNIVTIYTLLKILRKMRSELGLEAMDEYMEKSAKSIESANPRLGHAVETALSMMSIERIYRQMMGEER